MRYSRLDRRWPSPRCWRCSVRCSPSAKAQAAIVLNLGRVVRTDIGPGLHFKWPLVENARVFDRRLTVLDADAGALPHRREEGRQRRLLRDRAHRGPAHVLPRHRRRRRDRRRSAWRRSSATRCATRSTRARCRRWSPATARRSSTSQLAAINTRRRHAGRAHRRHAHQAHRPAHGQQGDRRRLQPHARPAPAGGQPACAPRARSRRAQIRANADRDQAGDRGRRRARRAEAARRRRRRGRARSTARPPTATRASTPSSAAWRPTAPPSRTVARR